jgi:hypothetical protein
MEMIKFGSKADVLKFFEKVGASVGPRKGPNKRTNDQKELFNLREYLTTLASKDLLPFPLTVEKGESPDFTFCHDVPEVLGLEITQATTKKYQQALTETETETETEGGECDHLSGDGWSGNSPERSACAAILRAMRRKARKVRGGKYRPASRYDLLIYVDVEAFFYQPEVAVTVLLPRLRRWKTQWEGLGKVSIIARQSLYFDVTENLIPLTLFNYESQAMGQS